MPQLGRGCLSLISRVVGFKSPFPPFGYSLALPPSLPLALYPGLSSIVMTWVKWATSALMLTYPHLPQG